ncbi:Gamma tubulin complex component, C-terminal [Dillenia turbinata]|uniref:Gamma-tubulin complex component n=1 Tax=Dillenia turbinata TaxID=194707 RepID=A0AAN8UFE2_9MAGN
MDSAPPCPSTPRWNIERPFLTGRYHQETMPTSRLADSKGISMVSLGSSLGLENAIGYYQASVQELIVIDDLLYALVGIEGRYNSIRRVHASDNNVAFHVDPSMDLTLQELAKQIFPLCENFLLINQFVESRSQFRKGLVNHAFAAALRAFLLDYQAMVAQLEHQFRLGRLSMQGLWFYCQPMIGPMQALSAVIQKASASDYAGSAVLNLLQSQAKAMAGDNAVRLLLEKMTQSASSAYLGILERWVYEGVIDDPYDEFFIAENRSLQKESLTHDYDAKYWRQRYSLKDELPSFLANAASTILTTGKYLNVLRECGHNVQVPISENSKFTSFDSNHQYLECIKAAYDFASGELLNLIREKYDLMGKLRSIKHYLLLDQGDFLVHFMDIARDELMKRIDEISVEKLQSLLDLALRTTAAAADPCHEDLTCCVERSSLLKRLGTLKGLEISQKVSNADGYNMEDPVSITGLETFSLSYKVQWPLSLVISRKALTKYQLIFRFLFHCKHVDRQLSGAWQVHQVLEPNWHMMHNKLQNAKSIDEKVERLKSICLQYAAATQWLISSSIEIVKPEDMTDGSLGSEKYKQGKTRKLSQVLKLSPSNLTVNESIKKFEREFDAELQSLGPILSSSSQAEPYLTHLAQCILGYVASHPGIISQKQILFILPSPVDKIFRRLDQQVPFASTAVFNKKGSGKIEKA